LATITSRLKAPDEDFGETVFRPTDWSCLPKVTDVACGPVSD
jgi:hypothetical protein